MALTSESSRFPGNLGQELVQRGTRALIYPSYHPLPVVFDKASGSNVWDPEGKEYIDMLSAYS